MIGQTISRYRILDFLGAGGMGVVYLAEDERLRRNVALKFLPAEAARNPQALDRFRLEARTAGALSHPGICAVYDIGVHDDMPYIVMELLKGETLRQRVAQGPLTMDEVLDIGIQLADALEAAHAQGIVHRDIKPENIWLGKKLRVKILDFGLAKLAHEHTRPDGVAGLTATVTGSTRETRLSPNENRLTVPGTPIGTVSYMSPEQARGEEVDARTDIFSLGGVLYEMVTGRQAFGGSTWAVVVDAILNRAPVSPMLLNPATPQRLADAIDTALEKDRDLRYQTAAGLEAELKRILRGRQSGAMATSPVALTPAVPAAVRSAGDGAAEAAAPPADSHPAPVVVAAAAPARWWLLGAVAVAVIAVGLFWMLGRRDGGGPAGIAAADVQQAQSRLDARDYRAALAEASGALARDPANAEAERIRAAAAAGLKELDALLDRAREAMAADDQAAAARAVADAQALAPGDAQVTELAVRLSRMPAATPSASAAAPVPVTQAGESRGTSGQVASRPEPRPTPTPPVASITPPPAATTAPEQSTPAPTTVEVPAQPPPADVPSSSPPEQRRPPPPRRQPAPVEPLSVPVTAPAVPPRESDEVLVRRALATYERAIETRDIALFRSVVPDLSEGEVGRLRASFAQIERQEIEMQVEQLTITDATAEAHVTRVDIVQTGGRSQTSRSSQTIRLARRGAAWVIIALGR